MLHALLAPLALLAFAGQVLTLSAAPPAKDGLHNITFAHHLAAHGSFSRSRSDDPQPSNYREPLWPALLALGIAVHPGLEAGDDTGPCLWAGEPRCVERVAQLKLLNVIALLAAAWLAAAAAFRLTRRVLPGLLAFALVAFSVTLGREADRFYSEVVGAAAVGALALGALVAAQARPSFGRGLGVGALAGLAMLAKAIYQPFPVVLAAALAWTWWRRGARPGAAAACAALLLGALLVAGPWMLRNQLRFGSVSISAREHNLLFRADLGALPFRDYAAALVWFAPNASFLRDARSALRESGRVRLLDDDDPEGAYQRGHDRLRALKREPGGDWDARARAEALATIRADPVGYLGMSGPLAWRGLFVESGWGVEAPEPGQGLAERAFGLRLPGLRLPPGGGDSRLASSLLLFGAFAACAVHWLRRARWEALVFLLPALYGYVVYVMVSHMWVRFAVPLLPILCVCLAVVAWAGLRRLLRMG